MKNIKLFFNVIFRDFTNLTKKKLPLKFRLSYPIKKYSSLIKSSIFKRKTLSYLGRPLHYDNWSIPISIQQYPKEIIYKILSNIDSPPKKVLDIGGNIGQFSITLHKFSPKTKIFIFEPNKFAFDFLEKNTKNDKNIEIFNYGIGPKKKETLYFEENRSATGSIIKSNSTQAHINKERTIHSTEINLTDSPYLLTKTTNYDLIKIDVEGYELEVLKHLDKTQTKYLFIEISGSRKKDYQHSEILSTIEKTFGEYDILYQNSYHQGSSAFEVLFGFK